MKSKTEARLIREVKEAWDRYLLAAGGPEESAALQAWFKARRSLMRYLMEA